MVDRIKVEHEFIFDEREIPILKYLATDCLYVVTEDGDPDRGHLVRLVDKDCFDWISNDSNVIHRFSVKSDVLNFIRKFPPNGGFSSLKKRGENFSGNEIPVHLVLDAILSFQQGLTERETVKPLSRFQAIILEMSRE